MELFKLYGNILIKNEEAKKSLHDTQADAQKTADKFKDMAISGSSTGRELNGAFKTIQSTLKGFGVDLSDNAVLFGTWAVAGAAAIATVTSKLFDLANETAVYGDNIDKMSQKLGLSAEAYQKWDYVIGMAGGDIDSMAAGFKTMTGLLADAQNGTQSAIDKFEALGISLKEINSMSQEEMFEKVIYQLQGMDDATQKAAQASDMFGKAGQNLIPLLNQTEEATKDLLNETEEYGLIMSDESVAAAAKFGDSQSLIKQAMEATGRQLGEKMIPYFQKFFDWVIKNMPKIQEIMGHVFDAIGVAIEVLTPVIETLGALIGGLLTVVQVTFNGISTFLGPVISTIEDMLNGLIDVINLLTLGLLDLDHVGKSSSRSWDAWEAKNISHDTEIPAYMQLEGYANGGVVTSVRSIVGESGPEILDLSGSQPTITPIDNMAGMSSGGNTFNITISAKDVKEFNDIVRIAKQAQLVERMG